MWMQISAGRGPAECCLAVSHFINHISDEFKQIESQFAVLDTEPGYYNGTNKSVLLAIRGSEAFNMTAKYNGTLVWICKSPYRIKHERKNWFFNCEVFAVPEPGELDMVSIKIETMRSSGNGGQNVNKVESAVRAIHLPTGITVTAREERSQALNKKLAMARLTTKLKEQEQERENQFKNDLWMQHNRLVRGNPVQSFEGKEFKLRINSGRTIK